MLSLFLISACQQYKGQRIDIDGEEGAYGGYGIINEQIEEEIDLNQRKDDNKFCPAVCVAMYELKEDRCAYNECGSGCGPDGKTTFNSLKECKVNLKIDGYLEIATLKTGYDVGEKIELTNPSMSYREVKKLEQSLPKSKIQNTGSNPIKGYLVFKTQQNINGEWRDYQYILDELKQGAYGNNIRIINSEEYLALDKIFNPYDIRISNPGNYQIYAALRDENENVIETKSGKLENYYEFKVY